MAKTPTWPVRLDGFRAACWLLESETYTAITPGYLSGVPVRGSISKSAFTQEVNSLRYFGITQLSRANRRPGELQFAKCHAISNTRERGLECNSDAADQVSFGRSYSGGEL